MFHKTWPLIAYTVLTQFSVGLCMFLAAASMQGSPEAGMAEISPNALMLFRVGLISAAICLAIAMTLSVFHLGRPLRAYRAIANLKTSWLSREVLFSGLLLGLLGVSYVFRLDPVLFRTLLLLSAAAGLITILIMASAYAKTGRTGWDGLKPYSLFMISTIVLGAGGLSAWAVYLGTAELFASILKTAMWLAIGLLIAESIVFLSSLRRDNPNPEDWSMGALVSSSAPAKKIIRSVTIKMACGAMLSLLGLSLGYVFMVRNGLEGNAIVLAIPIILILSGQCISRYGFMSLGYAE